jgi:hypothetical protein
MNATSAYVGRALMRGRSEQECGEHAAIRFALGILDTVAAGSEAGPGVDAGDLEELLAFLDMLTAEEARAATPAVDRERLDAGVLRLRRAVGRFEAGDATSGDVTRAVRELAELLRHGGAGAREATGESAGAERRT